MSESQPEIFNEVSNSRLIKIDGTARKTILSIIGSLLKQNSTFLIFDKGGKTDTQTSVMSDFASDVGDIINCHK